MVIPLAIALFYVLALSYISNFIAKVVWKAKIENIVTSYKVQKKHITEETTLAAANFKLEQAKTGKRELEHLREQIEQLTKTNEKKDETIKEMRIQNEELKKEINETALKVNSPSSFVLGEFILLDFLSDSKQLEKEEIIQKFDRDIFYRLLQNSLIEYIIEKDKRFVGITEKGLAYLSEIKNHPKV